MENLQDKIAKELEKFAIEIHGDNRSAAARDLGLSNSVTLNHWIKKTRAPGIDALQPVFERLDWQLTFPGQSIRDYARLLQVEDIDAFNHQNDKKTEQNVPESVLEYVAQKKHRQPGLLFSLDMLEGLGLDAADGLLFTPNSDVMHPIISRGDQVLINRKNTQIEDGKIYLIHTVDYFVLRYVSRDLSGELILHTPGHIPEMRVSPESLEGFEIIGQVVWIGHFC